MRSPSPASGIRSACARSSRSPLAARTPASAERWITVVKVSADGARFITDYAAPQPRPDYLRRGSGYTSDPFLSADPQVEAEHFEVQPEDRASNTLIQERRRMEAELHAHLARWRRGSQTTRTRLFPVIQSCRDKLAQLQERSDR